MCKKCKQRKVSKYAQIIDAAFSNATALAFTRNEEEQERRSELQSNIQELKKELDDLRTKQMFEELPTKEEDDGWLKKQAEIRKKQIEAEYTNLLPIMENFVDKLFDKMAVKVMDFKASEAEMLKHA